MSGARPGALVLGMGNVLMGDEGVGVAVARRLERFPGILPSGTRIVDGGTLGLDLLPMLAGADALILVDAVELGCEPGTVVVLHDDEIGSRLASHLSAHQVGVADLLAVARLTDTLPGHVSLVGIQPDTVATGLELSPPVEAAISEAADLVRRELDARASARASEVG